MRRARRELKRSKVYLGRVYRDIQRKLPRQSAAVRELFAEPLARIARLLAQQRHDHNKLYSLHAPEVECIAKGKVHKKYEFGVKVSLAATQRDNFIVGARALPGTPFDGHTLSAALHQVEKLTGIKPERCFADRGYRGHGVKDVSVHIAGQKRGVTRALHRALKRSNAIEPIIGHAKHDGLMGRNYLLGRTGDAMNAILAAAGHNLRIILRKLRLSWLAFLQNAPEAGDLKQRRKMRHVFTDSPDLYSLIGEATLRQSRRGAHAPSQDRICPGHGDFLCRVARWRRSGVIYGAPRPRHGRGRFGTTLCVAATLDGSRNSYELPPGCAVRNRA